VPVGDREAIGSPLFKVRVHILGSLVNRGVRRAFPTGSAIYRAHDLTDGIYYVGEGLVKQFILTAGGVEKVLGFVTPGCLFGEALFFTRCPAQSTAVAVEDSVVYVFPRRTMEQLFAAHPELLVDIARSLSYKVRALTSQIWIMASSDSTTKVRKTLSLLTRESAERHPVLHLTHQALADLAGVHRVTASDILATLSREGILECRRGRIVVKRKDWLTGYHAD
jgi:CRP/FNR family cyclic AMP-dependent transcriptional regulator